MDMKSCNFNCHTFDKHQIISLAPTNFTNFKEEEAHIPKFSKYSIVYTVFQDVYYEALRKTKKT